MSTYLTSQAFACFGAAFALASYEPEDRRSLFSEFGVSDSYVHTLANRSADCVDYSSHKYIDCEPIERFMGTVAGSGVVGFWSFKDGSRLVRLCSRHTFDGTVHAFGPYLYALINPDTDDAEAPSALYSLEAFPSTLKKASLTRDGQLTDAG